MVCYRFVTVKKVSYGENYGLGCCGGTRSEVWQGKSRLTKASDPTKLSASALSNVSISVEKCIRNGYLLNVATKCAILWNQKLWCGSLFLLKYKTNKEFCSLKHRIKKGMFFVVGKMNLFGSGRGGSTPPLSLPLATRLCIFNRILPQYPRFPSGISLRQNNSQTKFGTCSCITGSFQNLVI